MIEESKMNRKRQIQKRHNLQQKKKNELLQIFKDKTILSFGFNCFPKIFLRQIQKEQETHFFDWMGSSMWSIRYLFENNFESIFDKQQIQYKHIMNLGNQYIWTHQKYYLRYLHDFQQTHQKETNPIQEKEWNDFFEKYQRRKDRFLYTLQNSKNILFFRFEEEKKGRIHYDEYNEFVKENELEELNLLLKHLQQKYPQLVYKVIFLQKFVFGEPELYEKNNNILILRKKKEVPNFEYKVPPIIDIFYENKDFILKNI